MRKSDQNMSRLQRRRRRRPDEAPPLRAARAPEGADHALDAPAHATAIAQRHEAVRELQAQQGNAHVQRLLAQQAAEAAAGATVAPQVWDGDHGHYQVYPDTQPLALNMVEDPKQDWPLPEKIAAKLRPVSALLSGGATQVEFKGGVAFKAALLMDLAWLMEQGGGRELLDALLASGRKLTLEFAPGGGELQALSPGNAELRPDGALGAGSDVLMQYAPEPWMPSTGIAGWEQRKPALELARALVAALPLLSGAAPSTREREPVTGGTQATGDDPLARAIALENRLRGRFGLPPRPTER